MAPKDFRLLDMRHTSPIPKIGQEINEATRPLHYAVNIAIITNLPFALPPYAQTLKPYLGGLASFGHIYTAFERVAAELTSKGSSSDKKLTNFLTECVPDSLKRSKQLEKDLDHVQRTCNCSAEDLFYNTLHHTAKVLATWKQDFATRVKDQPHILVAYYWCMYMAIFAGGHVIKVQLAGAGREFWERPTTSAQQSEKVEKAPLDHLGYSFLSFTDSGDLNGLSIAEEFKKRLVAGEDVLTIDQHKDIVKEAQDLFKVLTDIVNALAKDAEEASPTPQQAMLSKRPSTKTATSTTNEKEQTALPPPPVPHRAERPLNRWVIFREIFDIVLVCILFAGTWQVFALLFMV